MSDEILVSPQYPEQQQQQQHHHHASLLPAILEHEAELPRSHHHSSAEFEDADAVDELADADFDILPIRSFEADILHAVRSHQLVIIIGETGSGKTTQIPQIIMKYAQEFLERPPPLADGSGGSLYIKSEGESQPQRQQLKMAITQPRRIAAISVAQRVQEEYALSVKAANRAATTTASQVVAQQPQQRAREQHLSLGGTVGYTVRFDDTTSAHTRIKFMTDGILIRECLSDSLLSQYALIMLDEAHERSLNTDILFGLLKQVCARRPDLKVIVTSATLDADKFGDYFNHCPIIHIPGRLFPVDIYHSKTKQIMTLQGPANNSYIQAAVDIVLKIHRGKYQEGHILVFLTGSDEIDKACQLLRQAIDDERQDRGISAGDHDRELIVLPLYSALSNDDQVKVFQKPSLLIEQQQKQSEKNKQQQQQHWQRQQQSFSRSSADVSAVEEVAAKVCYFDQHRRDVHHSAARALRHRRRFRKAKGVRPVPRDRVTGGRASVQDLSLATRWPCRSNR
jgi:HrpA-like RNA helicase